MTDVNRLIRTPWLAGLLASTILAVVIAGVVAAGGLSVRAGHIEVTLDMRTEQGLLLRFARAA